jgi:UDP-glucose 4-epimerase
VPRSHDRAAFGTTEPLRVLVTGASGFIGGVVADALAATGHRITALFRDGSSEKRLDPAVEVVTADLLEPHSLLEAGVDRGFDAVCHLAALTRVRHSRSEPLSYYATNVTGTINLLAALDRGLDAGGPPPAVVFGSTGTVYGDPGDATIPEGRRPDPPHPYAASKLAAEQAIAHQAATGRIGAVVLRSFNVAGGIPGHVDRDVTRIIPAALAVAAGRREVFRVNGDGRALREYMHVTDLASAYGRAITATLPGDCMVFNVGSGAGVSVNDVLAAVERGTGREVRRVTLPPVPEPRSLVVDSRRIRTELGWSSPRSTIDRIVADAWACSYPPAESGVGRGDEPSAAAVEQIPGRRAR